MTIEDQSFASTEPLDDIPADVQAAISGQPPVPAASSTTIEGDLETEGLGDGDQTVDDQQEVSTKRTAGWKHHDLTEEDAAKARENFKQAREQIKNKVRPATNHDYVTVAVPSNTLPVSLQKVSPQLSAMNEVTPGAKEIGRAHV